MSMRPEWNRLAISLALVCWRVLLLAAYSRVTDGQVAHEKKPGPSIHQRLRPRGQAALDFGKFSATQRVPPQVGSIRAAVRFITCATCTTAPAHTGTACTGGLPRNDHINATPLTTKGQRLGLTGGDEMR